MKKSLFLLAALCGLHLASAEASNTTTSSIFGETGTFTVTFELPAPLEADGGIVHIGFGFGDDGSNSARADISLANSEFLGFPAYYILGGSIVTLTDTITPSIFKLKVTDNFTKGSYCYVDDTGKEIELLGNNGESNFSLGNKVTSVSSITLTHMDGKTVTLGSDNDVILQILTAHGEGTIVTPGDLTIKRNQKSATGKDIANTADNLTVNGTLTLGTAETAATLSASGSLIATGGIVFANIGSSASADKLETTTLNVDLTDNFMAGLEGGSATLLTLNEEFTGTIKLSDSLTMNGTDDTLDIRSEDNKYIYTLSWETQLTRATANQWYLVLNSNINSSYVREALTGIASSHNGVAGMNLLNDVYAELNPQTNMPESDLAELIDTVDAGAMTDDALAAAAGASVAVLGQAPSATAPWAAASPAAIPSP